MCALTGKRYEEFAKMYLPKGFKGMSDKNLLKSVEGIKHFAMTTQGKNDDTSAMTAACLTGGNFTMTWNDRAIREFMG